MPKLTSPTVNFNLRGTVSSLHTTTTHIIVMPGARRTVSELLIYVDEKRGFYPGVPH